MRTITKLVQYALWVAIMLVFYQYVLAEEPEINWYTRPGNTNESILEICYSDGECHKLIHKDSSIESKVIEDWVEEITLVHDKIEEHSEK